MVGNTGGYRHLLTAVVKRNLLMYIRYPINSLGRVVMDIGLFVVLFGGGTLLAGQAMDDSIEGIVVGYFLWMLTIQSFQGIAEEIQQEANWGTLERHFMTPFGFPIVMAAKSIAILITTFVFASILLLAMMIITGTWLHLDIITILPIVLLTLSSAFGVGFAASGLTVLYKNIGSWFGLLNFVFLGLIAAPTLNVPGIAFLPLVQGSELLQRAMSNGVRLWEFQLSSLLTLASVGVGYLLIGYLIFHMCQKRARKLGTLGDY